MKNESTNNQELREAVLGRLKHAYYNAVTDDVALKNSVIPNKNHALEILGLKADEIMELIKQDQALREIDIRIDELENICGHSNEILETEIKARIKELQAKKDKLIEGV